MKLNYKYLLIALLVFFLLSRVQENFAATSPATLMQLTASGAQDVYLTGGDSRPAEPMLAYQGNIQKSF